MHNANWPTLPEHILVSKHEATKRIGWDASPSQVPLNIKELSAFPRTHHHVPGLGLNTMCIPAWRRVLSSFYYSQDEHFLAFKH